MLSNVLFPEPDGPMMAVSSPELKEPLRPWRISLLSERDNVMQKIISIGLLFKINK